MKTAVIFDNFGPYHLARLRAAAAVSDLLAIEVAASSAEYQWENVEKLKSEKLKPEGEERKAENGNKFQLSDVSISDFRMITLLERGTSRGVSSRELAARLNRVLDDFRPQAVFIPGWSSKAAFVALSWCARRGVPAVAMSESTEWDERRGAWREAVKRRIVGLCSSALVGGTPHQDYMIKLGMPAERIFLGYDAVDNGYFAENAAAVRSQSSVVRSQLSLPEKYFLASARFIEKKNLPRLIEAYARYRTLCEAGSGERGAGSKELGATSAKCEVWGLVLLGDGELRPALSSQLQALGLHGHVLMPGFKQYPDLPAYYGLAGAFIHASTTEQWGLVVNEAMASGLPVLVSNRCGCAADLVQEGVNGFTFDPHNIEEMAKAMLQISAFQDVSLSTFGDASRKIISNWGPERFASGLKSAAECAVKAGPKRAGVVDRLVLRALSLR